MILQALCELAERDKLVQDPDFPPGKVSRAIVVTADGDIRGIHDLRVFEAGMGKGKGKSKPQPTWIGVPMQRARSGIKAPPYFLVDNPKYVFGRPTADKPFTVEEGAEKSAAFRALLAECATETGDEGARAVLRALERVADGTTTITLPEDCTSNEQFVFLYEPDIDVYVHERPAVQQWWRRRRAADSTRDGDRFECVVTGQPVSEPDNFPKVKNVPGGQSSGVSLVSFNAPAFEAYGLHGNENAPIARPVAESAATALWRLVHPAYPDPRPERAATPLPRRHVVIGDSTLVCFWAGGAASDGFLDVFASLLDGADPEQVGEMYRAVWRGRVVPVATPERFYALTLSGAQGRLVIRDWFESTVASVAKNLARYFAALDVVRNAPVAKDRPPREGWPLHVLLESLAAQGKRENVPASLGAALVRAALTGESLPYGVLTRAVERARAEIGRDKWEDLERRDARAALIKAVLSHTHHLTADMDPTNTNAGYLCGRLMAVLERLQQTALGDVNAGVVDRYFGAASASPRLVFMRLLKNRVHYVQKAQDDDAHGGTARWLDRQLDEIMAAFSPAAGGFPASLSLEDQGLFILGYHQQRHWLWLPRAERERADAERASAPTAA